MRPRVRIDRTAKLKTVVTNKNYRTLAATSAEHEHTPRAHTQPVEWPLAMLKMLSAVCSNDDKRAAPITRDTVWCMGMQPGDLCVCCAAIRKARKAKIH